MKMLNINNSTTVLIFMVYAPRAIAELSVQVKIVILQNKVWVKTTCEN